MNQLDVAIGLNAEGRFAEALAALENFTPDPNSRNAKLVLRAELLERVGRFGQSRAMLDELAKSKQHQPGERSSCEFILGRIEWEEGAIRIGPVSPATSRFFGERRRRSSPQMLAKHVLASRSVRLDPGQMPPLPSC